MPSATPIPAAILPQLEQAGPADIVVGIPTLDNASTASQVVRQVRLGLKEFYPSVKGLIVNADGGSGDGTIEAIQRDNADEGESLQGASQPNPVPILSTSYEGIPGKGSALRLIFQVAQTVGARACAIVDANLREIDADRIHRLVQPVFEQGYDCVTAHYSRNRFEGTLSTGIVYPATRMLYGRRIRQPGSGEFCFSPGILDHFLKQDVWHTDIARYGIDVWAATEAICGGFRIAQVRLGVKLPAPKSIAPDLSTMLVQVLGGMYLEMERNSKSWQRVRSSEEVPMLGEPSPAEGEPGKVDAGGMMESFQIGLRNLFDVWSLVMPPATLLELKRISRNGAQTFRFPDNVWARIILDFGVAYHTRILTREHLLRALMPLYLGWLASFVLEVEAVSPEQADARVEQLCRGFEAEKPYLISRWRWPDRFNP